MNLGCPKCGATLKVNPNLLGATVTCPNCAASIPVRKGGEARAKSEDAPRRAPPPAPAAPRTLWLLLGQLLLFVLAGSCVAGALFRGPWKPPQWSYFQENPIALFGAAFLLVFLAALSRRLPLVAAGAATLLCVAAAAWHWNRSGAVDASRILALSVSLTVVWLALEHRRALR